jgi:hypothetical protein
VQPLPELDRIWLHQYALGWQLSETVRSLPLLSELELAELMQVLCWGWEVALGELARRAQAGVH